MGRFAQADIIITGVGNAGAWDRYAAMLNNPITYTDPSGNIATRPTHDWQCGPDGIYCDQNGYLMPPGEELYNVLVEAGMFNLPKASDVPDPGKVGVSYPKVPQKTVDSYEQLRKALFLKYGWAYVGYDGKINDVALMAIIIFGEFHEYKGHPAETKTIDDKTYSTSTDDFNNAYYEALEGLSAEYDHYVRNGSGSPIENQLTMLLIVQSVRGILQEDLKAINSGALLDYKSDAENAVNGYTHTGYGDAWIWGDVMNNELDNYGWNLKVPSSDPNKDWFIVQHK